MRDGAQNCIKNQIENLERGSGWEVMVLAPDLPPGVPIDEEEQSTLWDQHEVQYIHASAADPATHIRKAPRSVLVWRVPGSSLLPCTRYTYRTRWTDLDEADKVAIRKFCPDVVQISSPGPLACSVVNMLEEEEELRKCYVVGMYHTHFPSYIVQRGWGILLNLLFMGWLVELIWVHLRHVYRSCNALYVPTQAMMHEVEEHIPNVPHRWVVGRGLDTRTFRLPNRVEEEVVHDTPDKRKNGALNLCFVSRIVHEKRVLHIPQIMEQVCRIAPSPVNLVVCGDGPAFAALEAALERVLTTCPNFSFTMHGNVPPNVVASVFRASSVFIFPSVTETYGQVVVEAQACGCVPVVADCPVMRELVSAVHMGVVVRHEDGWGRAVLDASRDAKVGVSTRNPAIYKTWMDMAEDWEEGLPQRFRFQHTRIGRYVKVHQSHFDVARGSAKSRTGLVWKITDMRDVHPITRNVPLRCLAGQNPLQRTLPYDFVEYVRIPSSARTLWVAKYFGKVFCRTDMSDATEFLTSIPMITEGEREALLSGGVEVMDLEAGKYVLQAIVSLEKKIYILKWEIPGSFHL